MKNSIDYPGERAPRRKKVIAQAGYTGKNHYTVTYHDQQIIVRAADELAAMFTAAKHWGYAWTRLVYMADLGQIMLAKLTPGREEKP